MQLELSVEYCSMALRSCCCCSSSLTFEIMFCNCVAQKGCASKTFISPTFAPDASFFATDSFSGLPVGDVELLLRGAGLRALNEYADADFDSFVFFASVL